MKQAPLMWSQEFLWITGSSSPPAVNLICVWNVPPERTAVEVGKAVDTLVERYEALRTTFHVSPEGLPVQQVKPPFKTRIPVYDVSQDTTIREDVITQLTTQVICADAERPFRAALLVAGDSKQIALAFTHLAVDGWSVTIIRETLAELLADVARPNLPPGGRQPAEQAMLERAPDSQRKLNRARDYWQQMLAAAPSQLFPFARRDVPPGSCLRAQIWSADVHAAAEFLAKETATSISTVYLTVFVACMSLLSRNPRYAVFADSNGRSDAALHNSVGCYFVRPLLVGSIPDGCSFVDLAPRVHMNMLKGLRYSWYSYCGMAESQVRAERKRGLRLVLASTFNYLNTAPPDAPDDMDTHADRVVVEETDFPIANNDLTLRVKPASGGVELELIGSAAALTPDELSAAMKAICGTLQELADSHTSLRGGLRELLRGHGSPAPSLGPNWTYVDSSWIDIDATRDVIQSIPGIDRAFVRSRAGKDGGGQLTAWVAAAQGHVRAWQLRRFVMDRVSRHSGVMVPHRFIIVAAAPPNPGDATEWQSQQVVEDDNGHCHSPSRDTTPEETALCSAIRELHRGIDIDVNVDYVTTGGRAVLTPAVVRALERRGYTGLTPLDLLQPYSVSALARNLRSAVDSPA